MNTFKIFVISVLLLIGGVLVYKATTVELPSASQPILFYANQSRQDLKLLFCEAIRSAKHSLFASFYGLTDHDIISHFAEKAHSGVAMTIEYDHKASLSLAKYFPKETRVVPIRSKGLMHRKIMVIDEATVLLGSANLTHSSLRHHSNFVMGLYSPTLAAYLRAPTPSPFAVEFEAQKALYWLLPDQGREALNHLLSLIQSASKTIRIAMFTFTHPQITEALIQAKQRGVSVSVIIDAYSGRGASKKSADLLHEREVQVVFSQGQQLLHHKWAIIDDTTLVMGSANWTKAAFTKNEDFLFILSPLKIDQRKFLNHLWDILELESEICYKRN